MTEVATESRKGPSQARSHGKIGADIREHHSKNRADVLSLSAGIRQQQEQKKLQHLFLPPEAFDFSANTARIGGSAHLHLARVLRARIGETLVLLDNSGRGWVAALTDIGKSETQARLEGLAELPPEPPVFVTVAQAIGKGDKFETVVQHGTEAGASAFVPLVTERGVVQIPPAKHAERRERWQQIAQSASEQSHRARLAEVGPITRFAELVRAPEREKSRKLLLHPSADAMPLHRALKAETTSRSLQLWVGPEGGWSPQEISQAQAANIQMVTLGPRVLRTETAALVAVSQILFFYETL